MIRCPSPTLPRTRQFDQLRVHSFSAGDACLVPDEGAAFSRPLLLVWWRGAGVLRQHGASRTVPAGSLCFLANDAVVRLSAYDGGAVVLELPREVYSRSRERIAAAVDATIGTDAGAPAFLRSFIDTLDRQLAGYCPDHPGWVQACVCDITERVLAESARLQPTSAQRSLLAARDYVTTHLSDLDLTPNRVARAAAVSLRTLNRLFAAEGDTIGGLIRRQRLERCREDLLDPAKSARSIGQISAQWGFLDAAHFSRSFKDAYGCSPRVYRTRAGAPSRERESPRVHRVA